MNNVFIFLRHAQTLKNPNLPVVDWGLTDEAQLVVEGLLKHEVFEGLDFIFTSTENKAKKTAEPFVELFRVKAEEIAGLEEIKRGKSLMLSDKDFLELKTRMFEDFSLAPNGWESSSSALARFEDSVSELDQRYKNKKILIVSHGTVLTLYFAKLLQINNNIMQRWQGLKFCSYGVVENNEVLKDIIK